VTAAFTVSGTADDFDADAFKTSLLAYLPHAMGVTLTVSAASVRVEATIIMPTEQAALSGVNTLQTASTSELSSALGATVEAHETPTIAVTLLGAPSPPPFGAQANSTPFKVAHGLLMVLAWGAVLPAGALVPRFWRHALPDTWLVLHRRFQYTGSALVLVGLVLSIVSVSMDGGSHFGTRFGTTSHNVLGLVLAVLALVQVLGSLLRPSNAPSGPSGEPSTARRLWRLKHMLLGYGMIAASISQLVSGIRLLGGLHEGLFVALYVGGLVLAGAWGFAGYLRQSAGSFSAHHKASGIDVTAASVTTASTVAHEAFQKEVASPYA
jgi:hypothetical protein